MGKFCFLSQYLKGRQISILKTPFLIHVAANMGIDAYDSFHFAINAMIANQNMLIKRRRGKRK